MAPAIKRVDEEMIRVSGSIDTFLTEHYYPLGCNLRTAAERIGMDKRTLYAFLVRRGYKVKPQSECQSGPLNGFYGRSHKQCTRAEIGDSSRARQERMPRSEVNGRYGNDDSRYYGEAHVAYVNGIGAYRRAALAYYGGSCMVCGDSGKVDVHHRNGDRSDNRTENLSVLCLSCHRMVHKRMKKYKNTEVGVGA